METIGFDLDGVLYPVTIPAYTYLVANCDLKLSFFEFWEDYTQHYSEIFYDNLFKISTLYDCILPTKNILNTLNYLSKKYNICYITARPKSIESVTRAYLKRYNFPNFSNIEFSNDKSIEIRTNRCLFFIEDCWEQEKIDSYNKVTNIILMDQIYNKHIINVLRIKNLNELKELL